MNSEDVDSIRHSASIVTHLTFSIQSTKDPSKQYFSLYGARLDMLRHRAIQNAKNTWGLDIKIKNLVDLKIDDLDTCIVCGVLYKNQILKPSVLREFSEEFEVPAPQRESKFVSDTDEIVLEDEMRIRLIGNIDVSSLLSGMVIAAKGNQEESGKFCVMEICFPAMVLISRDIWPSEDWYIVIASGLNLNSDGLTEGVKAFADCMTGWAHCDFGPVNINKIAHIILAGNSISSVPDNFSSVINSTSIDVAPDMDSMLGKVDDFLNDLSMCITTSVMPGNCDPVNLSLPQQPLHRNMFPKASTNERFRCVTNPYSGSTNGCLIIGTSGQNINDMMINSSLDSPLAALESSLKCGLIAPTCPDTLACFPLTDSDPFVFTETPRVYFAGNQQVEGCKILDWNHGGKSYQTLLVSVPDFSRANYFALINMRTLQCQFHKANQ